MHYFQNRSASQDPIPPLMLSPWNPVPFLRPPNLPTHGNKNLSCRKETMRLLLGSVLDEYNWKAIFRGHYRSVFNHCDVIVLRSYWIRSNNAKLGLLRCKRSFKVTDVGTNRKPVCDFLLIINTNWHSTSYRLKVIADFCSIFGRKQVTLRVWAPLWGLRGNVHCFS